MKLQESIEKLKEIRDVAKTYGVVIISEGDSRAIGTVLAAFPQSRQMTAEDYIRLTYGETWLREEWSPGDVMDIMEDYAIHRIEEEERLFRERIESDAELWGRVGAKPPRLSNSTDPMPKED